MVQTISHFAPSYSAHYGSAQTNRSGSAVDISDYICRPLWSSPSFSVCSPAVLRLANHPMFFSGVLTSSKENPYRLSTSSDLASCPCTHTQDRRSPHRRPFDGIFLPPRSLLDERESPYYTGKLASQVSPYGVTAKRCQNLTPMSALNSTTRCHVSHSLLRNRCSFSPSY